MEYNSAVATDYSTECFVADVMAYWWGERLAGSKAVPMAVDWGRLTDDCLAGMWDNDSADWWVDWWADLMAAARGFD